MRCRARLGVRLAEAIKLLARAHQSAVWERTRQVLRMRSTLPVGSRAG